MTFASLGTRCTQTTQHLRQKHLRKKRLRLNRKDGERKKKMAKAKKLSPPSHLSAEAKKLFTLLGGSLDFRLKAHHTLALAEYCETHLQCVRMRKTIDEEGMTIHINDGKTLVKHPLWDPLNQVSDKQYKWAMQLGIAPHAEAGSKLGSAAEETKEVGIDKALAVKRGTSK